MHMEKVNYPQDQITYIHVTRMSDKHLQSILQEAKAEKSYMKTEMKKLGKLSLGNITSYYQALKNIQNLNFAIKTYKAEMAKRAAKPKE